MWSTTLLTMAMTVKVVGVIASSKTGVALIQKDAGQTSVAVKAGEQLSPDATIESITRDMVSVRIGGQLHKIKVGEDISSAEVEAPVNAFGFRANQEIERQGHTVRLTAKYRDHLIKNELMSVLMQAAAVPYFVDGDLRGFRLSDIEPGSVYEQAGFKEGDIVTTIENQPLKDVGMTIRLLQSLREASHVEVRFLRDGVEQMLAIDAQ